MALSYVSLPQDVHPRANKIELSLYELPKVRGTAPTCAIQRVTAINATNLVAGHLELAQGIAVLQFERTAFLASGQPVAFTSGLFRSDVSGFVSELRLDLHAI